VNGWMTKSDVNFYDSFGDGLDYQFEPKTSIANSRFRGCMHRIVHQMNTCRSLILASSRLSYLGILHWILCTKRSSMPSHIVSRSVSRSIYHAVFQKILTSYCTDADDTSAAQDAARRSADVVQEIESDSEDEE
jgi:hypothetical protein